jgi:gliding motility-associated-like protein
MKHFLLSISLIISLPIFLFSQENTVLFCTDGIDNDGDGTIDCNDEECKILFNLNCASCIRTPDFITGKSPEGSPDTSWEVSHAFGIGNIPLTVNDLPNPDDPTLTWTDAISLGQCASTWVKPSQLPFPLNQAKWITHPNDVNCISAYPAYSNYFYKVKFNLPCSCNQQAITSSGAYTISINAYVDNSLLGVYINGVLQNLPVLPGGSFGFGGHVQLNLSNDWLPGENEICFLVQNFPRTGGNNPQGLLAVMNQNADNDNDNVPDFRDQCLCGGISTIDTNFIFSTSCNPLDTMMETRTFHTPSGCDSTVVKIVSYDNQTDTTFLQSGTCEPNLVGLYCKTEPSAAGCDSTICREVTLTIPDTIIRYEKVCDSTLIGSSFFEYECDSVVTINRYFESPVEKQISIPVCTQNLPEDDTLLFGCDSIIYRRYFFEPLDTFTRKAIQICEGESIQINGIDLNYPGIFCSTFLSKDGCDSITCVELKVHPRPLVEIIPNLDTIYLGDELKLSVRNLRDSLTQIEWFENERSFCQNCEEVFIQPSGTTEYLIQETNKEGCISQASARIIVDKERRIFIPNVFSPNGDGINDYFTIFSAPGALKIKSLRIFDRWGDMVFENLDFEPNITSLGWDGTFRGMKSTSHVFAFYAEIIWADGLEEVIKGDITIAR